MVLIDTAIWADHIAQPDAQLDELLGLDEVVMHPFVVGEIALGNLRDRSVLVMLESLPAARVAFDAEVLLFIETQELYGSGVGYVDAHLLLSARLTPRTALWTRDRRLHAAAVRLGVAWGAE